MLRADKKGKRHNKLKYNKLLQTTSIKHFNTIGHHQN